MAGRRFDAPGLSDALVGVTLMSDAIADMCGDDEEWEGSPQKGMRKKFLKISGRLKQYAEDGARAAHMHMAVAVRYDQEYGAPVRRGLDFFDMSPAASSASKTVKKKHVVEECFRRKQSKDICLLKPSCLVIDDKNVHLPANGDEYTPVEAINILMELHNAHPKGKKYPLKHIMTEWSQRGLIPVSEVAMRKRVQKAKELAAVGQDFMVPSVVRPWRQDGRSSLAGVHELEEWAAQTAMNDRVVGRPEVVEHLNAEKLHRHLAKGYVRSVVCVKV